MFLRSEINFRHQICNPEPSEMVRELKNIIFNDLCKIDFLDSSGLGALVQVSKEFKALKLGFTVVGNSRVAQTIKLVRLGDFLNLKSDLDEALANLKS